MLRVCGVGVLETESNMKATVARKTLKPGDYFLLKDSRDVLLALDDNHVGDDQRSAHVDMRYRIGYCADDAMVYKLDSAGR